MLQSSVQLYRNAYRGLSRSIWWLSLVIFVNRCGTMVIPFLTVYLTHEGYTLQQAGYVMGAFGVGSLAGSYIGGICTDRIGFYRVQLFSLFLNGILFIILGQMKTLIQIGVVIFILSSIGEAFRPANAAAIAAYSNETNRTRCYSLNRLAINLGWAIGPAVGGLLASINYTLLFWVDGLTCIIASLLMYFVLSPEKKILEHKKEIKSPFVSAYKDPIFLRAMLFVLMVSLCFFQYFSILPVYYKQALHLKESMIGLVLAMNGIVIVLVEMVLVYKLENKRNPINYIVAGIFLIAVSFILLNTWPLLIIAILGMLLVTFGEMFFFPFMNNFWVKRSNEKTRGEYAAVYSMAFSIGIVFAPTMASQIAAREGFSVLWTVDFIICCLACIGFIFIKRKMNFNERIL